jgi:hypothetical protein
MRYAIVIEKAKGTFGLRPRSAWLHRHRPIPSPSSRVHYIDIAV